MNPLVIAALVGTAQRGAVDVATGAPLAGLIEQVGTNDAERRLLLQAGMLATCRAAGVMPVLGIAAQEPARAEKLPPCSPSAAALLQGFLSGTHPELLPEALERLRLAGLRLPFDLLPLALSTREHRSALAPVLGERGRWLAGFNPVWAWAHGTVLDDAAPLPDDAETIWQEGTAVERVAVLRQVRAADPGRASEWLNAVWKREKAEMRAELLAALEVNLSAEDEAFLEMALEDRGGTVRDWAAQLLARLPESALRQRMVERADTLLTFDDGKLKVNPPTSFSKAALRDRLVETPPTGKGERAWWILQYLSRVPPTHWTECFGVPPDVLVTSAGNTEWKWPLIEGWTRAFLLHGEASWIMPLWRAWSEPPQKDVERQMDRHDDLPSALARHVPKQELERLAGDLLDGRLQDFSMTLSEVLSVLPRPWGEDLGAAYLGRLRRFVGTLTPQSTDFAPWDDTLEVASLGLPRGCFSGVLEPFTLPESTTWYLREFGRALDEFTGAIRLRQRVIEEIPL